MSKLACFSIIMGTFSLSHTLCSLMMDPDVAGSDHSCTRRAKPLSLCLLLSFQVSLRFFFFLLNTAAQSEKRKQFRGLLFLYSLASGFLLETVCVCLCVYTVHPFLLCRLYKFILETIHYTFSVNLLRVLFFCIFSFYSLELQVTWPSV